MQAVGAKEFILSIEKSHREARKMDRLPPFLKLSLERWALLRVSEVSALVGVPGGARPSS